MFWLIMLALILCNPGYVAVDPVSEGISNTTYVGPVEGHIHYTVIVCDGVDQAKVADALLYVPNWIEFSMGSGEVVTETKGDWAGWHYPTANNTIVVFDGDNAGFKYSGGAIINDGTHGRIGIAVYDRDSRYDIGMRAFHEVLHAEEEGYSADYMMLDPGFLPWVAQPLRAHSIQWERLYYDYMMINMRGDSV
jgi:hypothetical protein